MTVEHCWLARFHGRLMVSSIACRLCSLCWSRKLGDGLFLECCKEVASGYPEITFDSMIVDNTAMQVWFFSVFFFVFFVYFWQSLLKGCLPPPTEPE